MDELLTPDDLNSCVERALDEDIGNGDVTAALLPPDQQIEASVICRESAVIAGRPWFDQVYAQLCLLYTSPSPRDGLLSRMPSSA